MGVPFWQEDTNAWDRVEIGGVEFAETQVDVEGDFGNDWDVKKSPGADGAPATNKGYEPCRPKLTWLLYLWDHFDAYVELLAKVQPRPGKTAPPEIEVVHPQLQLVGKVKFRIVKIHTLKKVGPQMMQAQFDLLEYFPTPKPIPPKPAPKTVPARPFTDSDKGSPDEGGIIHPAIDFQPRPLNFD
jgi:hypothetical protein